MAITPGDGSSCSLGAPEAFRGGLLAPVAGQRAPGTATVPLVGQGIDPAKKIIGRKRHLATDTLGLLLAVTVTAAGTQLLTKVAALHPTVTKAWADNGYKTKAVEHAAHVGIDLGIVQRDPTTRGFHVQPRRWVVERTLGWLVRVRRLARDYETHPHGSPAKPNEPEDRESNAYVPDAAGQTGT